MTGSLQCLQGGTILTEVAHKACPSDPCITMDMHPPVGFTDVPEELMVTEDGNGGLAVK